MFLELFPYLSPLLFLTTLDFNKQDLTICCMLSFATEERIATVIKAVILTKVIVSLSVTRDNNNIHLLGCCEDSMRSCPQGT